MRFFYLIPCLLSAAVCGSFNYLPTPGPGQIIRHFAYTIEFYDQFKQPSWVAYMICRSRAEDIEVARSEDFRPDPAVRHFSATPQDYVHSGYDKGHLAPSADFRWNGKAQSESFFMSNMSPQKPGFNRGIWKRLEDQVRKWAVEYDTLYVVTGPILEQGLQTIGPDKVAVPHYYYKVVLDYQPVIEAVGFIMRNEGSKEPLSEFAVSVDEVERITGIDFFPALPDPVEKKAEERVDMGFWHLIIGTVSNVQGQVP